MKIWAKRDPKNEVHKLKQTLNSELLIQRKYGVLPLLCEFHLYYIGVELNASNIRPHLAQAGLFVKKSQHWKVAEDGRHQKMFVRNFRQT